MQPGDKKFCEKCSLETISRTIFVFKVSFVKKNLWKLTCWFLCILIVVICAYQGVRNVLFSENLACFVFLKHSFWDSPFYLITNDLCVMQKPLFDNRFFTIVLNNINNTSINIVPVQGESDRKIPTD